MTQSVAIERAEPAGLALHVFGAERVAVLKEQLSRGWKEAMTDAELEHIALVFQRTRLDPLAKPPQIYWIKRYDSKLRREVMTGQLAIDGLRLIAQRSREYGGQLGPFWTADGKEWVDVWLRDEHPAAAKVGVLRKGFREPVWSVATWKEWAQHQTEYDRTGNPTGKKILSQFWASMGANMLAKTAEAMSLKRAFPQETNDLELAAVDAEWRQQETEHARRYSEIFSEEDVVVSGDRLVDRTTGEVIRPRELTGPAVSDQGGAVDSPRPSSPPLVDKYKRNRELIARARELGVSGYDPLKLGQTEDVVDAANLDLEDRIARAEWEIGEVQRQKAKEGLL
jgi:hypothetical protein